MKKDFFKDPFDLHEDNFPDAFDLGLEYKIFKECMLDKEEDDREEDEKDVWDEDEKDDWDDDGDDWDDDDK